MSKLIRMKLGENDTVLVEVPEDGGIKQVSKFSEIIEKTDEFFDKVVQHEIIANCKVLIGAFEELKKQELAPKKACAEFGLQLTGEGNVYVVKTSGQASFKISLEWDLS